MFPTRSWRHAAPGAATCGGSALQLPPQRHTSTHTSVIYNPFSIGYCSTCWLTIAQQQARTRALTRLSVRAGRQLSPHQLSIQEGRDVGVWEGSVGYDDSTAARGIGAAGQQGRFQVGVILWGHKRPVNLTAHPLCAGPRARTNNQAISCMGRATVCMLWLKWHSWTTRTCPPGSTTAVARLSLPRNL